MPAPRPPEPDDRRQSPGERRERRELRDALLTFAPAIVVAFVFRWALVTNAGWAPGRALFAGVAVGIVLALLLQRALRSPGGG